MSKQEQDGANYYDGSSHAEFSEEIADGASAVSSEQLPRNDEWRRYIGGNPFAAQSQKSAP